MTESEIRRLLQGAPTSFRSLHVRAERWVSGGAGGGEEAGRVLATARRPRSAGTTPSTRPWQCEVWLRPPDALREEIRNSDGTLARMKVVNGTYWQQRHGAEAAPVRIVAPAELPFVFATDLQALIDPAPALEGWALEAGPSVEMLGREALTVRAHDGPRDTLVPDGLGYAADQHELIIDRRSGLTLRAASLRDGQMFWIAVMTHLAADSDLGPELFALPL